MGHSANVFAAHTPVGTEAMNVGQQAKEKEDTAAEGEMRIPMNEKESID